MASGSSTDVVSGTNPTITLDANSKGYTTLTGSGANIPNNIGNTTLLNGSGTTATIDTGSVGLTASNQELVYTNGGGSYVTTAPGTTGEQVQGTGYIVNLNQGSEGVFYGARALSFYTGSYPAWSK